MKILITGGAGFLGSHLCESFIEKGHNVTCVDILASSNLENLENVKGNENFTFVELDVTDTEFVKLFSDKKFDVVMHFASRAAPDEYQKHQLHTIKTNSLGTENALEIAKNSNAKFILASTSEVYGDAQVIPTPETYYGIVNSAGPRSCYDVSKRFAETLTLAYNQEFGVKSIILRIFNTYGPRIRPDGIYARALPKFINQALNNEEITVYGDGSQTRSFCYIDDFVEAVNKLVNLDTDFTVVNVGNNNEVDILTLAKKIKELTNSDSKITFHPFPKDDPRRRNPDTTKIEKLIDWQAKTSLEDGLKKTINWFRK